MEALFYLLESVVLAAMTWLYVEAGKRWLPWVTGATAVAFAVARGLPGLAPAGAP